MTPKKIQKLLDDVAAGTLSPDEAMTTLQHLPFEDVGDTLVDHHRVLRQKMPEVVFGQKKTTAQLLEILGAMHRHQTNTLITRLSPEKAGPLIDAYPQGEYDDLAQTFCLLVHEPVLRTGTVVVACAGTSDLSVAREATVTVELNGYQVLELKDVGVAGLHRLLAHRETLQQADVVIVIAGMEGALPSVIGGLVSAPVIAVPTSVGYGASFGGLAALLGMLNSCASGVTVVNIDNGFGAAVAACRILNQRGDHE